MNHLIESKIKLQIFSKYIGQQVWIESINRNEPKHRVGILTGVTIDAVEIKTGNLKQWIMVQEELSGCTIKLLLKPLSKLTENQKKVANSLPVTVFITQYYIQLGFDMPVFIAPGHLLNCRYAVDLGLADYRLPEEILALNERMLVSNEQAFFMLHSE